jgi:hypothetical protein
MDNLWFNMAVSVVLTAIKAAFKNEQSKEDLKKALLKIRDAINLLYPEETEV